MSNEVTSGPIMTDVQAWCESSPVDRLDTLKQIAARSGRELQAMMTESEPHKLTTGGPRLLHRRTGLRFCFVPGGRHLLGTRRDRRAVDLAPFLLAEVPLGADDASRCFGLKWRTERTVLPNDVAPLYVLPDELSVLANAPSLRLPTDDEWEAAYRAGTLTTYFWGETQPKAPPALPHPLGLSLMGFFDELTVDPESPTDESRCLVRGGAARIWPWDAEGNEWMWLMSAANRPWAHEDAPRDVAVRLVLRLSIL